METKFSRTVIAASPFQLTAFTRFASGRGSHLVIYLEGDGRAWLGRDRLSPDPTPSDPYVLGLASRDQSSNVAYVARPCQYTPQGAEGACHPRYWSDARFAEEVVASVSGAIDTLKARANAQDVTLIGYSGGGTVAALIAARRDDIHNLVTIAAPLDLELWTKTLMLTPLTGSLDPVDAADKLGNLPQLHLFGADDDVVPPSIGRSFLNQLPEGTPANMHVVEGFDHYCCWQDQWPGLMNP